MKLLRRYEKFEMDENNVHLIENASYAMQGLSQKAPDELQQLGISFSALNLQDKAESTTGNEG